VGFRLALSLIHAGHDAAVGLFGPVEENARFHIDSLTTDVLAAGKALFEADTEEIQAQLSGLNEE